MTQSYSDIRKSESDSVGTTLGGYFQYINRLSIRSVDDQQELAERYVEHNDIDAGQQLILSNLRLVIHVAQQHARQRSDLLELIQEGNLGLAEAVTRYNPYRNVKFSSYAQFWIRAMILNYVMNQRYPVKLGSSRAGRKLFYNLRKARRTLRMEGHSVITTEMIADYLNVNEEDVIAISAQLDAGALYLDAPLPGEEATATYGSMMPTSDPSPEESTAKYEFWTKYFGARESFGETLDCERKKAIWQDRVSVPAQPKHLAVLGDDLNLSKERVRQIEGDVKDEFKSYLEHEIGYEAIHSHLSAA